MKTLLTNAYVFQDGSFSRKEVLLADGHYEIVSHGGIVPSFDSCVSDTCYILPGFCDVHVHFREPGFTYKEDTASGSAAAARGGYTAVCTMPNLHPTPDSSENLALQEEAIRIKARIAVFPYGTITKGERGEALADMADIADRVIGFSDDGRGVQSDAMMKQAMQIAKDCKKMIVAHCEDNSLLDGGYIHKGCYAQLHGHRGICSESEWKPIERDLALAAETGCSYHVCHISCKESVALIREAKKSGINVTCETAPHYLVMNDSQLQEEGRFKMNPPIRSEDDRLALLEGILDGTIDMIATDHAPHSAEEKGKGLEKSLMGVVGLETAFPVLYTYLVKTGVLSMERLVELLSIAPRRRFGIASDCGFCVWNVDKKITVDPADFLSNGKSSPFTGCELYGSNMMTVYQDKIVYQG